MSRRIELTVPNDWVPPVRSIISDSDKCNLSDSSEKPGMVVEVAGANKTLFLITIPGPAVSGILQVFRKNGIGTSIGRVVMTSVEYMKPDLTKPLASPDLVLEDNQLTTKKGTPLTGIQQFMKARKTTEEMYAEISNNANMTINTWLNLIGASIMAAGGLTCNVLVFIVAAMLVSPIMGPILGMTMGYRVADFDLFRRGFINECKMAITTVLCGCCFGFVLGDVGKTYKWPNDAMMPEGQSFNLLVSIIVSAAAGMVLSVSLTSTGGNALVGTAISAGLLPPLVNAGMMWSYSAVYAPIEDKPLFYATANYNFLFYVTHVITIVVVANVMFWLKDIDPRFREGEDCDFNEVPALLDHKRALEGRKLTEKEKAEFFIQNVKDDLREHMHHAKETAGKFFNAIGIHTLEVTPSGRYVRAGEADNEDEEYEDEEDGEEYSEGGEEGDAGNEGGRQRRNQNAAGSQQGAAHNPLHPDTATEQTAQTGPSRKAGKAAPAGREEGGDIEMQRPRPRTAPPKQAATPSSEQWVAGPLPPTTSPASPAERVAAFYRQYNPTKTNAEIDAILLRYAGREDELLHKLHKQYNVPLPSHGK